MVNQPVLIVDDEVSIRQMIRQSLEASGCVISEADNGLSALESIKKSHPDLIISDVMMPKMSGFEVCEKAKKEHGLEDVVIVLLTAKGQEVDREKGLAAGANEYLTKPFDPDDIYDFACETLGIDA